MQGVYIDYEIVQGVLHIECTCWNVDRELARRSYPAVKEPFDGSWPRRLHSREEVHRLTRESISLMRQCCSCPRDARGGRQ